MKALTLLLVVIFGASAFGTECESRLRFELADLVERAMVKGVLDRSEAEKLARSEHAYNPLEFKMPTPENSAFKEIFGLYAKFDDVRWAEARVKVRERILKADERLAVQAAAERETRDVIIPKLVVRREARASLLAENGIFYSVAVEDGQICAREVLSNRRVWCSPEKDLHNFALNLRLNPESGAPELRLAFNRPPPSWLLNWATRWSLRQIDVVDLSTGRASTRYAVKNVSKPDSAGYQWQKAGRTKDSSPEFVINHVRDLWGGVEATIVYLSQDLLRTNFSVQMRKRTVESSEAYLDAAGEITLGVDVRENGKRWVEVYVQNGDYGDLKQRFEIADLETKLSFFENEDELYMVIDQLKGKTKVLQPLKSPLPLYEGDLNASRDEHLQVFRAPDGRVYLAGRKTFESVTVFSPFARTR